MPVVLPCFKLQGRAAPTPNTVNRSRANDPKYFRFFASRLEAWAPWPPWLCPSSIAQCRAQSATIIIPSCKVPSRPVVRLNDASIPSRRCRVLPPEKPLMNNALAATTKRLDDDNSHQSVALLLGFIQFPHQSLYDVSPEQRHRTTAAARKIETN